jgi:hypothetical protein
MHVTRIRDTQDFIILRTFSRFDLQLLEDVTILHANKPERLSTICNATITVYRASLNDPMCN